MKIRVIMEYDADEEILEEMEDMGFKDPKQIAKLLEASIRLKFLQESTNLYDLKVECVEDDLSAIADVTFLDILQ